MTRSRALVALLLVLLAVSAFNTLRTFGVASQVSSDEHTTCVIQNRGLGQQKYLVGSLDELHQILTLPQTRASKRNRRLIPKRELRRELRLLRLLDRNLAAYVRIAHRQPRGRSC